VNVLIFSLLIASGENQVRVIVVDQSVAPVPSCQAPTDSPFGHVLESCPLDEVASGQTQDLDPRAPSAEHDGASGTDMSRRCP